MAVTIKLRQGLKAALPSSGMEIGEPLWATNTKELYIADSATTAVPAAIDTAAFSDIGDVASGDFVFMHDISVAATASRARKITFGDFKAALNIPPTSTDQKVATIEGATAGFLGTNGSDGVLRAGVGLGMSPGAADAYVTMALAFESQAQGDIIYRGNDNWARLAAGTDGTFLESRGAGMNPRWHNVIDGGVFA